MAFVNDFLKSLAMPIGDLAKWLEEEHQVPVDSTIAKWNELTGMEVVVDGDSVTCEDVEDQTININKKKGASTAALNSTTCQHVFIAGNRKGQQCTTKPKGGNDRCSAHKIKAKKNNSSDSDTKKATKKSPKKVVKNLKSKEIVDTESESDGEPEPVTKPKKKIPPSSGSESESEEEKPTPKKRVPKKIPPKMSGSEESESD